MFNLNKTHGYRNMPKTVFFREFWDSHWRDQLEASPAILVHRQYFCCLPRPQGAKVLEALSDTSLSSEEIKAESVLETFLPFRTLLMAQEEQSSFPRSSNRYLAMHMGQALAKTIQWEPPEK